MFRHTMFFLLFAVVLISPVVLSRNIIPNYMDLDEEDKPLFRAAYDTPAYNHEEYEEIDELPMGKLDLLKDGLWAIKAKIRELVAFDKALAANILTTKIKLKELLAHHLAPVKKHHHVVVEKKKPAYEYQAPPPYEHPESQHAPPAAPAPAYHAHDPYYGY